MAKIAIYDTFYQSTEHQVMDIAGQALAGSDHEVIGSSNHILKAAQQIIHFAGLEAAEQPDVVIMGGMLEGETAYRKHPATITEPCPVRRTTWYGKPKEEVGQRITFLLPQFEQDRVTYHFPQVVVSGKASAEPPDELLKQWDVRSIGMSGSVLSRIVETYLPDTVRLGVSSDPMFDAVLSSDEVDRFDRQAVAHLKGKIERFTSGNE